jgi:saccharopine dehydrogenase-like NADP-dependent oxidoreductase
MIDHSDPREGLTSMARTTAFPCSIAAQMLGAGEIQMKGLIPPEIVFKGELRRRFLRYLEQRRMKITTSRGRQAATKQIAHLEEPKSTREME